MIIMRQILSKINVNEMLHTTWDVRMLGHNAYIQ